MTSVAIVTLNIVSIIVFTKNRSLRRRSTYLLINLAVADMLVGGFSVMKYFYFVGGSCDFWKYTESEKRVNILLLSLHFLFPVSSLTNIAVISIERVHATFWPFRHRAIKKTAYGLIIAFFWVMAVILSITLSAINLFAERRHSYFYLWSSFNGFCLLVICVSYALIVIKVRCGVQPQHHGAASRERKLTVTLFIVTFVSLLMWLPFVLSTFLFFTTDIFSSLSQTTSQHFNYILNVLFYANSLVNPILYSVRMPEFRRALRSMFCKRH
ncbi:somatostatin receptor type 5-like [Oculina patagonica]